jgi:DcuC family C4-dicarboxylate transporter
MGLTTVLALAVVIGVVVLVVKGWDVRLVLLAGALTIGTIVGTVSAVIREFLATFSNEKFVVPICTAMGFAYVLRHTGCERHLVLLLIKPLRSVRGLLVPGIVAVGFLVNIPVISQTSTAVCIGPVVVPLMRAAGYSMATIGACLLLGSSVGGELLNPGAPELLTIFDRTGVSPTEQTQRYLPPLVFTQLGVSMLVLWLLSFWWEKHENVANALQQPGHQSITEDGVETIPEQVNLLKAVVPLVPVGLLFASGLPEPYKLFDVPDRWVILAQAEGQRHPAYNSRLIGLTMLMGVLVAAVVTPNRARDCVKQFFEGAGYGFTNIVSLIVTANCFGKAIESAGLAQVLGQLIAETPQLMLPLATVIPLAFATVSGSGMASTQSLYGSFYGPAVALGLDPVSVGALVSLGSAAGRTMSPVAAVALMCATLTGTNSFTLARRVAIPLLLGIMLVVCLRMLDILGN